MGRLKGVVLFGMLIAWMPKHLRAQQLEAHVQVLAQQIRGTDPNVFSDLQKAIEEFLNTRSWTNQMYAPNERIVCNFTLNLQREPADHVYSGTLTVQSSRPVYNSSYSTPVFNDLDRDVTFKYEDMQPLTFNDNRVSGGDALQDNLSAILAFYAYTIIGLDEDSFQMLGGRSMFEKAENIVNNAPEDSKTISGWQAFENDRNRYWLASSLMDQKYAVFQKVLYKYHRLGLDQMYSHPDAARKEILDCLSQLNALHAAYPTNMIVPLFFVAKAEELQGMFSEGPMAERLQAIAVLDQLDPEHAGLYQKDLK